MSFAPSDFTGSLGRGRLKFKFMSFLDSRFQAAGSRLAERVARIADLVAAATEANKEAAAADGAGMYFSSKQACDHRRFGSL